MEAKLLGEAQSSGGLPTLSTAEKAEAERRRVAAVAAAYAAGSGTITAQLSVFRGGDGVIRRRLFILLEIVCKQIHR